MNSFSKILIFILLFLSSIGGLYASNGNLRYTNSVDIEVLPINLQDIIMQSGIYTLDDIKRYSENKNSLNTITLTPDTKIEKFVRSLIENL